MKNLFLIRSHGCIIGSARGIVNQSGRYLFTVWSLSGIKLAECEAYTLTEVFQDSCQILSQK